ncbi:FAD-binding protein [Actinomycetospora sp. TBRC 11914]|uniref:FAD-binding protein n=1 Tax=Actinomycetospora sp. TBRC 11914 TaxID=2729387 RepID=UPI00145E7FF1|nr:FAD-binding protein [Actinomycetospora sp. TBRC 11914]NMO88735.1 FAD-binding protein [Actinomycetospora sp. TBRC 11914]
MRGPGWTSEALLTLDALVDGPVHPPFSVDAALELALARPLPVRTQRRVVAVVGATGTADVARVLAWAAEHDIEVVVLGVGGGHAARSGDRPVVALSLTRADRTVADPARGTVRAGVGAAWAAVRRVAVDAAPRPSTAFARPGTVAAALGATTLRGATVVTGDGVVHTLPGPGCATELWWALRAHPGAVGVVTAVVLDARYTTAVMPRERTAAAELLRLVQLSRRHDPAGLLGVPHPL